MIWPLIIIPLLILGIVAHIPDPPIQLPSGPIILPVNPTRTIIQSSPTSDTDDQTPCEDQHSFPANTLDPEDCDHEAGHIFTYHKPRSK